MGKGTRSNHKQVYKRNSKKIYIKGDRKVNRKEAILEWIARIIAMIFYPFYLIHSNIKKHYASFKETIADRSQLTEKTDFKSKIKSFKLLDKIKHFKFTEIEIPKLETYVAFVNGHKIAFSGALALLLIVFVGTYTLTGLKPTSGINDDQIERIVIDTTPVVSEPKSLAEKPVIENLRFSSLPAYELVVNENIIGYFQTEAECQSVLDELSGIYTTSNADIEVEGESGNENEIVDWYFEEEVEIVKGYIDISQFEGYDIADDVFAYITKGTKEERTHKVEKGENYWVIANYYGINPSDLEAANPTVKPETLQIGQEISLVVPKPIISVCTVEKTNYTDVIDYEVAYEETSSLYKDESKTKIAGVEGEKAVSAEVIKENGREIARTVLSETVLSEPTTKVVYKGTKDPPPRMGTGVLKKPTSRGSVTSEFGYRWGSRHEGIDIGLPVGSDVKASDGGVVTFSGYSSSYGYYLTIDHGGNVVTLYAHNSKLLVSKGDKVYQGQVIAKSGNTGRSTGPHLHFEVRINGTPVNPRGYVNF